MRRQDRFFKAWEAKRMIGINNREATREIRGPVELTGPAGVFSPPHPAIPCWVAPLQSPTPFHRANG